MQIRKHFVLDFFKDSNQRDGIRYNNPYLARRAVVFHFLPFQQKVKRKFYFASSASRAKRGVIL